MAEQSKKFLALLRGINIGGRNIIGKDALKQCFEDLGLTNVRTYIQSGNVLFRSNQTSIKALTRDIERGLAKRFSYDARLVVLSQSRYKLAVQAAPDGWGKDESQQHHALFILGSRAAKRIMAQLPAPKPDKEKVSYQRGVIFWSVSRKYLTSTALMKVSSASVYHLLTLRNHNTVYKLLELFDTI